MALNKDIEKIENEARSFLALMPKAGAIKFPKKIGLLTITKTYKLRPYALKDKIYLAEKYGEKELIKILSSPDSVNFLKVHAEIIFNAMQDKDRMDFKGFDDFLSKINSPAKEVEMLLIALELRGLAENPKLTKEELEEVLANIKEDLKKKQK